MSASRPPPRHPTSPYGRQGCDHELGGPAALSDSNARRRPGTTFGRAGSRVAGSAPLRVAMLNQDFCLLVSRPAVIQGVTLSGVRHLSRRAGLGQGPQMEHSASSHRRRSTHTGARGPVKYLKSNCAAGSRGRKLALECGRRIPGGRIRKLCGDRSELSASPQNPHFFRPGPMTDGSRVQVARERTGRLRKQRLLSRSSPPCPNAASPKPGSFYSHMHHQVAFHEDVLHMMLRLHPTLALLSTPAAASTCQCG